MPTASCWDGVGAVLNIGCPVLIGRIFHIRSISGSSSNTNTNSKSKSISFSISISSSNKGNDNSTSDSSSGTRITKNTSVVLLMPLSQFWL